MPEILGALTNMMAGWKDDADFRQKIALQHEIVHYLQDLLTGAGYWDYLVAHDRVSKHLKDARMASWMIKYGAPPPEDWKSHDAEMTSELIMVRSDDQPIGRRESFAAAMEREVGEVDEDDTGPYHIENLLEGEAVATVWLQYRDLQMTKSQKEIADANRSFFDPTAMAPSYRLTIGHMIFLIDRLIDKGTTVDADDRAGKVIKVAYELLVFLVDLACAHPSPSLISKIPSVSKGDFEPGLKFVRLARALQSMPDQDTEDFVAAFAENDVIRSEELLLKSCKFPYPPSRSIYTDWMSIFEERMKSDDDDRLLRLRAYCCQRRLEVPDSCQRKTLASFVIHQVPLYFINPDGINSIAFSWEYLNPEESSPFMADLLRHQRDWGVVDFFLRGESFVCPLAEANLCDARTAQCLTGISKVVQFPSESVCSVRSGLSAASFSLD